MFVAGRPGIVLFTASLCSRRHSCGISSAGLTVKELLFCSLSERVVVLLLVCKLLKCELCFLGAGESADIVIPVSSRLEAIGEAVLQLLGVHPTLLWLEAMGWRAGGPKWFVHGGGRIVSVRWRQYGPDCSFIVRFEVLLVKFRVCSVFSFLLCPLVRFVLSQLHIQ